MNLIAATSYLPPICFFAYALQSSRIYIEVYEHFVKQSYRNRASIATAQGKLDLIIPVIRVNGSKTNIRDVRISYDESWQKQHWHAIESAYNTSPFFEYYKEYFYPFYSEHYRWLLDFNNNLLETVCSLLSVSVPILYTADFLHSYDERQNYDVRYSISPKKEQNFNYNHYIQVFEEKNGFIPGLSILDLICNLGPESIQYIEHLSENV
ncbi:MAG: WbqC family protein [Bacteroidales bacterium]